MKKALYIMLKEVRDFLQDKGDLAFSLLLPVLIFGLMYGAFGSNLQFNGTAHIVNQDEGGIYSTELIQRLKAYTGVTVQQLSPEQADSKLERSAIQMAVYIPPGFSSDLASSKPVGIVFKQRGNGGTEGQIISSLVQGVAQYIEQEILIKQKVSSDLAGTGASPEQIDVAVQQFLSQEENSPSVATTERTVGSSPDAINQFLPGILTMFVLFAINMTAQSMVAERRRGTLERLLTTRLKTGELFAGKFMAYLSRGFIQTLVLLLLAYAVFSIFTPISFLEAMVVALVFSAVCSAIGLIISSVSKTQNQAIWISVFFTMLMVMLSGTFVPVTEGTLFGTLSHFSINTYANDAFRTLISLNGSLGDIQAEIYVMAGVAIAGLLLSRLLFRATQEVK
jgi:ABC-2 type transport system permease protein